MKKEAKGEMHGSAAERILAANRPDFKPMAVAPMFAMGPGAKSSSKVTYSEYSSAPSLPPPPPMGKSL